MDEEQRIHNLFSSFREVNQVFYHTLLKTAQRQGITPIQFIAMKTLAEHPHIGLSELAERIHLGNSTVSGVVDRMVKAGFVVRERSETDRRTLLLNLSPKGEKLWQETNEIRLRFMSPLLELTNEDQAHLLRIHGQIVEILGRIREETKQ